MNLFFDFLLHSLVCVVLGQYTFKNLIVVTDLLPEDCYEQNLTYIEPEEGALPQCGNFSGSGGVCSKFFKPSRTRKPMINEPTCTTSGTFGPKQCKGEYTTGRCFCFDSQGNRLFGQQWWSQAEDMTCACSRRKADMGDSVYFNSLHCNSIGNYEKLQCDAVSKQCWCVDEQTGDLTSPVVPQVAITKLPCYNSNDVGSQYLRKCENQNYAQKTIEYQLNLRGTTASFGDFLCDGDGAYGAYAIIEGAAFCTWRDNSKISSFRSGDDMTAINCNCARDTKIFENAGKSMQQKCTSEGNYQTYQTSGDTGYCIDLDGYKTSPSDVKNASECSSYSESAYH